MERLYIKTNERQLLPLHQFSELSLLEVPHQKLDKRPFLPYILYQWILKDLSADGDADIM
jgi:hypothetical protein